MALPTMLLHDALKLAETYRCNGQGRIANILLSSNVTEFLNKIDINQDNVHLYKLGLSFVSACDWQNAETILKLLETNDSQEFKLLSIRYNLEKNNLERAKTLIEIAQRRFSTPALFGEKARLLLKLRQYSEASNILDDLANSAQNKDAGLNLLNARAQFGQGKKENVLGFVKSQYSDYYGDADFWALAALIEPSASELHLGRALSIQPNHAEVLVNRSRNYLRTKQFENALADAKQAAMLKPWMDEAIQAYITSLQALGRNKEAFHYAAYQFDLINSAFRAALYVELLPAVETNRQIALSTLNKFQTQFKDDPVFLLALGTALHKYGELDKAIEVYKGRLKYVPNDWIALNNLGKVYYDKAQPKAALSVWQKIDNPSVEILRNMAFANLDIGLLEDAERQISALIEQYPGDEYARCAQAEIDLSKGNFENAKLNAEIALTKAPYFYRSWLIAFRYAIEIYGWESAEKILLKGIETLPEPLVLQKAIFTQWQKRDLLSYRSRYINDWCVKHPDDAHYILMAADCAYQESNYQRCLELLEKANTISWVLTAKPKFRLLMRMGRYNKAIKYVNSLLDRLPNNVDLIAFKAEALSRSGEYDKAISALKHILRIEPNNLEINRLLISILFAAGYNNKAVETAEYFEARSKEERSSRLLLDVYKHLGRKADALKLCEQMLKGRNPELFWSIEYSLGLNHVGRRDEAIVYLEQLFRVSPNNFAIATSLASALQAGERYEDALSLMKAAWSIDKSPAAIKNVAELMLKSGFVEEAISVLEEGLNSTKNYIPFYELLSLSYSKNNDHAGLVRLIKSALDSIPVHRIDRWLVEQATRISDAEIVRNAFKEWLSRFPQSVEAHWAVYQLEKGFGTPSTISDALDKLVALRPNNQNVLQAMVDHASESWVQSDAIKYARKLIELYPTNPQNWSLLLNQLLKSGDYSEFDNIWQRMMVEYGENRYRELSSFFFAINCHPTWTSAEVFKCYNDWYSHYLSPKLGAPYYHRNSRDDNRRLKIAYVSPDFCSHPVAYFSEPILMNHNRTNFEVVAYSHLKPNKRDDYTRRFEAYVDRWVDITSMSDDELFQDIRKTGIDIVVDLAGHTANNKLAVLLRRPAPIQASWVIGAGQTTGIPDIDYLISDAYCIPPNANQYFSEKVYRLPSAGLPFLPPHFLGSVPRYPYDEKEIITFGVLTRPLRTNDRVFQCWSEILKRVPNSRLWFDHAPYADASIKKRIIEIFGVLNIGHERLVFANTRPHFLTYSNFDIVMDPFPAGSGTTGSEALYMGRPVITLDSRPPMGRIVGAQIEALGLSKHLIADTEHDYVEKAVELATKHDLRKEISQSLRSRFENSYLMNYKQYAEDISVMYRTMWINWCRNTENSK